MESKNLIAGVIAITLSLILTASVMVPVLTEATTTERTFTNDGLFSMDYVDNTYEETIVWDYTDPDKVTVGTDEVDFPTDETNIAFTFMGNDDFFVRYVSNVGGDSFVQLYRTSTTAAYRASVNNSQTMTITISNGTATFDNGSGSTVAVTFDNMYCITSGDGDFVLKNPNSTAYLVGDSPVFAHGGTYLTSVTFYTTISGTPEDGFTRVIWPSDVPLTATDLVDDLEEVSGYVGLYSLDQFTYTITNTNTSATGNVIYSQFIVPAKVTVELSQHLGAAEIALVNVLPLLVIVAIVLMAAGMIYIKRD